MRALLVLALCACSETDRDEIVVGVWDLDDPEAIVIPSTMVAGQPITFTIVTHGSSCVSYHSTEVEQEGETVDITPYDRRSSPDGFCDDVYLTFEHAATVTFSIGGRNLVRIHGSFDERGLIPIERDVLVNVSGGISASAAPN